MNNKQVASQIVDCAIWIDFKLRSLTVEECLEKYQWLLTAAEEDYNQLLCKDYPLKELAREVLSLHKQGILYRSL